MDTAHLWLLLGAAFTALVFGTVLVYIRHCQEYTKRQEYISHTIATYGGRGRNV